MFESPTVIAVAARHDQTAVSRVYRFARSRRIAVCVAAAGLSTFALLAEVSAREPAPNVNFGPQSVAPLAKRLTPAVVNISTTQVAKGPDGVPLPKVPDGSPFGEFFEDFFNRKDAPRGERKAPSLGSGFVIDGKEGLIVTNNHVIEDADEIVINFADGTRLKVEKIVGRDLTSDLALLKVKSPKELPAVSFGSSSATDVGDWVLAIGNPFGLGGSVSVGIISAKSRNINSGVYDDYLQTDAAINKGNSGGPLFNMKGEVIGVNTAIISPTGGSIGIGFAVPSDTVASVIAQLKNYGVTRRGWLGVRLQSVGRQVATALHLETIGGALVADVVADGPADEAGLSVGDVIVAFDGKPVTAARDLPKRIAQLPVGKRVAMDIVRDGKKRAVNIEVGMLTEDAPSVTKAKADAAPAKPPKATPKVAEPKKAAEAVIGLMVRDLDDNLRRKHGFKENRQGALIESVKSAAAVEKGIRAGDLVVQSGPIEVRTAADVAKGVSQTRSAGRRAVLLGLEDKSGDLRFVAVPLEDEAKK